MSDRKTVAEGEWQREGGGGGCLTERGWWGVGGVTERYCELMILPSIGHSSP